MVLVYIIGSIVWVVKLDRISMSGELSYKPVSKNLHFNLFLSWLLIVDDVNFIFMIKNIY